jgi:hypothetical protein
VSRAALGGFVTALAAVAAVIFVGVLINEINYADDHPFQYGPAKVIAWAAGGGAVLSIAVALVGFALMRSERKEGR